MKGDENTLIIDIFKWGAILNKYGLSDEEDLIIIKGDEFGNLTDIYKGNKVDYVFFNIL